MNMFEKAERQIERQIDRQMKDAKVLLSYQDGKVRITFKNASIATYGFVIYEILSDIAEKHPEMTPPLLCACKLILERGSNSDRN